MQSLADVGAVIALVWALTESAQHVCVLAAGGCCSRRGNSRPSAILWSFVRLSLVQGVFLLGPGAFHDDSVGVIMPVAFAICVPIKYFLLARERRFRFGNFMVAAGPHAAIVAACFALTRLLVIRDPTVVQTASWIVNLCSIAVGMLAARKAAATILYVRAG